MKIRQARESDLPRLLALYADARIFMARSGNPHQWSSSTWPPEERVRRDIAEQKSYVCTQDDRVIGAFSYEFGSDVEPAYRFIRGAWRSDAPYGVVHRLVSDRSRPGIGAHCLRWSMAQSGHLRIDTHEDNAPMRALLAKLGFSYCGIITLIDRDGERLAFDWIGQKEGVTQ